MPQQTWNVTVERQVNVIWNQKGVISDFNQLIRIKDLDPGKSPLKDKPIYLVLNQTLCPFLSRLLQVIKSLCLTKAINAQKKDQRRTAKKGRKLSRSACFSMTRKSMLLLCQKVPGSILSLFMIWRILHLFSCWMEVMKQQYGEKDKSNNL